MTSEADEHNQQKLKPGFVAFQHRKSKAKRSPPPKTRAKK
jgi:hypothetical protein